ncbi:MAG: helix-turn-helix transcriptional regulator [Marinobacter sp.]
MTTDRIFRPESAADYISVSRSTFYRLSKDDPTFPSKIRLSARCVGYRGSELKAWLEAREVAES